MKSIQGFTITQTAVSVAILGVLTAIAVPSYNHYSAKSQASEATQMIAIEKIKMAQAFKNGQCTTSGNTETIKGKYGTLSVSGSYKAISGEICPIGCTLTFNFNSTGVDKNISGKVVKVDVMKNLKLHKNSGTTLDQKYLPPNFTNELIETPDVCVDLKGKTGSITSGYVSGNETGDAEVITPPPGGSTPPPGGSTTTPENEPPKSKGTSTNPGVLNYGEPAPYRMEEYWSGSNFDNRDDTYMILVGDHTNRVYTERDPDAGSYGRMDNHVTLVDLPLAYHSYTPTNSIPHNFNTPENIANFGFRLSFALVSYEVRDWWSNGTSSGGWAAEPYKEYPGLAWIHTLNDAGKHTKLYLQFKGTPVLELTRFKHTPNGKTWYRSNVIEYNAIASWISNARRQMVADGGSYEFTISTTP